jgi:PAS domain S-box-containing protein
MPHRNTSDRAREAGARRSRWLWLGAACALLCLAVVHLTIKNLILPSFIRLERESAESDLCRCIGAIAREMFHLEKLCGDWSNWDDTYRFVEDRNQAFLDANIDWPTLESKSGLNVIMIYRLGGERLWGAAYRSSGGGAIQLDEFGPALAASHRSLLAFKDRADKRTGLLITSHGPLLLSAQPIMRTDGEGPFSAALIMGRFLDKQTVRDLAKQTRVRFVIKDIQSAPPSSEDARAIRMLVGQPFVISEVTESHLHGSALLRDLLGKPALLLSATFNRDVMEQGLATAQLAALATEATVILAVSLLVFWYTQRINESRRHAARVEKLVSERTALLREAQSFLETALAQSPAGIVIADAPDVSVRLANPAALGLFGGSRSLLADKEAAERVAQWRICRPDGEPCEADAQPLARAVRGGEVIRGEEFIIRDESGSESWVSVNAAPIRDAGGAIRAGIAVLQDVTSQKRAQEVVSTAQRLKSIGTLAGGIAHDFNNILMSLYGNISLAKDDLPPGHPSHPALDEAERSMSRAVRLTHQLLTFARGGEPVKEDVSIAQLAEEVARFDLSGSNVRLLVEQAPGLWRAEADRGQIQQVISNLTINAREAMPDGGTLRISLCNHEAGPGELPNLPAGRYVQIVVRDEGVGIDPKVLGRIYEPYFTTKHNGSGLGLATTFSIIMRHGGLIRAESAPGKGTAFTLHLPASAAPEPAQADPAPRASLKAEPRNTRILVVDDESPVRDLIASMLRKGGHGVETVADGAEAVRRYKAALDAGARYDLLIMDLTIPGGLGGKEALRQIRLLDPRAKAIASSGYAADPVIARGADYGFAATLAKPYTTRDLIEAVERVLAANDASAA